MNAPDHPMLMILAEISSGKATIRSLGALYMVAMASRGRHGDGFGDFSDINEAIGLFRAPNGDALQRARSLEPVKKVAWELYESVCHLQRATTP